MMVGREIKEMFPKYNQVQDEIVLEVEDFEVVGHVSPVTFNVKKGRNLWNNRIGWMWKIRISSGIIWSI